MAGNSEAADDLIAELAKLMAQDAQDTPPPKPAAPSPFTVRIPGESANAAPPRREEPVRLPPVVPPAVSTTTIVEPARPPRTSAPTDERDPFSFAFELGQRRNQAAPSPSAAPLPSVSAPVETQPPASVPAQPPPAPEPVLEHDSIADLIAAELASEQQASAPSPVPPSAPAVPERPAPIAESASRPQPAPNPHASWQPANPSAHTSAQDRPPQPQPRPTIPQPAPRPDPARSEQDAFKVPPVFGLAAKPSAPEGRAPEPVRAQPPSPTTEPSLAPTPIRAEPAPVVAVPAPVAAKPSEDDNVGLDPIDEIESLIGRAVRVDLDDTPQATAKSDRPALRSLATPQVPKHAPPPPRSVSSADEAILAAAQASGAEIGWVEAPETERAEPRARRERRGFALPRLGFSRALAAPLVAVTLLLAAGFGLYWVLGLGGAESGPPPLLTADATPVKETPPPQPEAATEQQSVVFNEIEGVVPGAEEQLVSRDQADVNEVTQTPIAPDVSSEGLANRKVRTVTVRPDGTIVSADNSLAGSTILPVDRPNVPAIPGAQTASPELLAAQGEVPPATNAQVDPAAPAALPGTPPADPAAVPPPDPAAAAPALPPTPEVPPTPVVTPGATVPAVDAAGNTLPGKTTVIPLQRPSSFAQRPQAAAPISPAAAAVGQDNAAVATAAQLPPPPSAQPLPNIPGATEVPAVSNDAPAYVQLASQRTEAEARATAQGLVTRFGPLFGGANMEVQRVDLGDRGIFYRVRVPANSLQQASSICTNVKAAGGDCFTM